MSALPHFSDMLIHGSTANVGGLAGHGFAPLLTEARCLLTLRRWASWNITPRALLSY
jgi:hypothetical protein